MGKISKKDMPCNKPKAQSSGGKSHVVKACYNGIEKIIRFGQQGASTAGKPKKGESDKMKAKESLSKLDTAKTLQKVKALQLIGRIKLNGK